MKVVIVGGVAGGASCAARLRRRDESAEIIIIERGPYVSYANCGLPYHVGDIIPEESRLLVANERLFNDNFNIAVQSLTEAKSIDVDAKTIRLANIETGAETTMSYDKLVLAPGAASIKPPLPGIDLPGIFHVRTIPDARAIRAWIKGLKHREHTQKPRAVVIGGGFIGLEMVENLVHLGVEVTLIEMSEQVLPPLDVEFARRLEERLRANGVTVALQSAVTGFSQNADQSLTIATRSGETHAADLVILSLGVRPDTALAKAAGLTIGERGGIKVDATMRTSNPDIFAVGDVVEITDVVTGAPGLVALAGPANRQGRIAADAIAGRPQSYRGTQGTAVLGLFGVTMAWTGASEKALRRLGRDDIETINLFPNSHASYYPGAKQIVLKVVFAKADGRLLGAAAFGEDGADKKIDTISAFIQMGGTVFDLEEAELCYAPQFGSAKDAINFAGMIGANVMRGDMPVAHWGSLGDDLILDVREASEVAADAIDGARHIPLKQLRARLSELPRDRTIAVTCRSGQRAYVATRILLQNGFKAATITGGALAKER